VIAWRLAVSIASFFGIQAVCDTSKLAIPVENFIAIGKQAILLRLIGEQLQNLDGVKTYVVMYRDNGMKTYLVCISE
jgi:hypothetical protein